MILYTDISDHLPVFFLRKRNTDNRKEKLYTQKRVFKSENESRYKEELSQVDWEDVYNNNDDPNNQYRSFTGVISELYDKHFPLKKVKVNLKSLRKPWITPGILRSIKRKNKLYALKLKNPSAGNVAKFNSYRNRLNHLLRYTKRSYYKSLIEKSQGNLRATWGVINEIINKKKSASKSISHIEHNGKLYKEKGDIASIFNTFFTNVGPDLAKKLPKPKQTFKHWMKTVSTPNFSIQPISEYRVLDALYHLDCSKAAGYENINIKYIQNIAETIYRPLCYIFNTSILTGIFPDLMKVAKVIPLFKNGSKSTVSNYRPISLLSTFSKIFEKLVCEALVYHLEHNHLIYCYQFGFRKKRSTSLAIVDFITRINDAIDKGDISLGVFLDLSKAFDTVDHGILLEKLPFYGIEGIEKQWFQSYFADRKQFVTIDGVSSDSLPITCGIPQGSTLGPILFLLYVNDAQFIMKSIHLVLYADDMNILHHHKNVKSLFSELLSDLKLLHEWLLANRLSVNLEKTKFLVFTSKQRARHLQNLPRTFLFSNNAINRSHTTKFLGIKIDEHLKWDNHIEDITRKIAKSVGVLYRARHYLDIDHLKTLYYCFIYPYVSSSALIWGSNYQSKLKSIFILQKRVVRSILFADAKAHSKPLFKKLGFLNIYQVVQFQLGELVYKQTNNLIPDIFHNYFRPITHTHNTRSRARNNLYLPKPRLNYGKFNVKYASAKLWNGLPTEIRNTDRLSNFKKVLRKFLLSSDGDD